MKNLKPITRHEQFLQDIADGEVDLKPITRQEYFLAKIAESGGGGGSSLPSYTSSDVGKVLTVGESVAPVWQTVGGGLSIIDLTDADPLAGIIYFKVGGTELDTGTFEGAYIMDTDVQAPALMATLNSDFAPVPVEYYELVNASFTMQTVEYTHTGHSGDRYIANACTIKYYSVDGNVYALIPTDAVIEEVPVQ